MYLHEKGLEKHNMASVKQECDSDGMDIDDNWLLEWSNNRAQDLIKTEELTIKSEVKDNAQTEMGNISRKTGKRQVKRKNVLKGHNDANKLNNKNERTKIQLANKKENASKIKIRNVSVPWKKALKHAKVNDAVSNLCEFECPECKNIFKGKQQMYTHLSVSKHASSTRRPVIHYLKKIVAHECRLCSKRILCDRSTIWDHLRFSHKLGSIKSYMYKSSDHELKGCKTRNKIELTTFIEKEKINQNNIMSNIGNLCNFSCLRCDYSAQGWRAVRAHIKKSNHGPILSYIEHAKNPIFLKCFVCKELMICDSEIVCSHLHNKHKISISKYRKMTNLPKICIPRLQYLSKLKSLIENVPVVNLNPQRMLRHDALPDHLVTKDLGNLSFFKCSECCQSDMSYTNLMEHLKSKHQFEKFSFKTRYVVEARYHRCHICCKVIICDNLVISSHINSSHKITMRKYQTEYVLKSGHKIYPSLQEYYQNNDVFKQFMTEKTSESTVQEKKNHSNLILPSMLSSESEDSD